MTLQSVVHTNERGLGSAVLLAQLDDRRFRQPRDRRRLRRRPLRRALAQCFMAECVALEVVAILQPACEQHVHHSQRERAVGSRPDRDPVIALCGGAGADRIDADDARATFAGAQHEGPQMWIRRQRVRPPQQHEIALGNSFGIGADVGADRHAHPDGAGHRADRAIESRGAELMEEASIHRRALQQAHRAGVGVGQDRLRSVARRGDPAEYLGNLGQCAVPGDGREPTTPFGADAAKRRREPTFMIGALDVAIDLRAQESLREGMLRVTGDARRPAILDGHEHGARVRAIVRAGAADHTVARCREVDWGGGRRGHGKQGWTRNLPRPPRRSQA